MEEFKKQQWKAWFYRYFPPIRLGMIILLAIIIVTLFIPPLNGMADNGSYTPILKANGLYETPNDKAYYSSFIPTYHIMQYYNPDQYNIVSLQNVFIQIALLLNKLFFSTKIFDLRFLSFLYSLLYLFAMWVLLRGVTKKLNLKSQYIIVALTIFLLGDISYIAYFNSFYRTPLIFILLILFVALSIAAYQQEKVKWMFFCFVLQFIVALILPTVTNTSGIFMVGCSVSLCGAIIFIKDRRYKTALAMFIVAMLPLTLFISSIVHSPSEEKEKFNSMTTGVLQVAKNPGKAMADLGMEPQNEMLRGMDYDQTYVIQKSSSTTIKEHFIDYIHYWRTVLYYLFHPNDLMAMLDIGLKNQNIVKNQQISVNAKGTRWVQNIQSILLKGATRIKAAFLPKKFPFYILASLIIVVVYSVVAFRGIQLGSPIYIARLLNKIGLILMILLSFITPVIVMGATNLSQQMEISSLILDLMLIAILGDYLRHDLWIDRKQIMLYKTQGEGER